ncbi:MAG: FAD-dependent oxidoreductase, partial [Ruminococcus sp.]
MNYVIIGNSTAAVGCIEGIRKVDTKGNITVISDEPHHTYGRPLISYMLLGKTDEEHMKYRPDDFYEKNNVKTILG